MLSLITGVVCDVRVRVRVRGGRSSDVVICGACVYVCVRACARAFVYVHAYMCEGACMCEGVYV